MYLTIFSHFSFPYFSFPSNHLNKLVLKFLWDHWQILCGFLSWSWFAKLWVGGLLGFGWASWLKKREAMTCRFLVEEERQFRGWVVCCDLGRRKTKALTLWVLVEEERIWVLICKIGSSGKSGGCKGLWDCRDKREKDNLGKIIF